MSREMGAYANLLNADRQAFIKAMLTKRGESGSTLTVICGQATPSCSAFFQQGRCPMTEAGWTREAKPTQMRAIPAMDRERFMAKVIPVPESGCWIWEGSLGRGYGSVFINGESYLAHRVSYQIHKGEIPEGLTIDHLCRVRCCVNPDHLEAVTNKENILRGTSPTAHNRRKTHCINGHELVPGNLKWNRNQFRQCHMCALQADRKPFAIANADKTHCIRGHEYTPENTRVLVRRSNGRETRYCKLCQKIRNEQAALKRINKLAQQAQEGGVGDGKEGL